jgi:hypothetical protein
MIMGLFANSTKGFGHVNVSGLSRVPNPPTRIKAFIVKTNGRSTFNAWLHFKTVCRCPLSSHHRKSKSSGCHSLEPR